jgi:UDP-glucose:(heptosyl)LPS alpha-1,3-glucosyltransferase
LVVGNPAARPAYQAKARELGLAGRVTFVGAMKDVAPAYRAADALVHPTLEDSFGMVVLEAMAHGLPVVVSGPQYCGAASLLHHGFDALVLDDPRDAAGLAASISRLVDDAALVAALSAAARQLAAAHSWHSVAQHYARLYAVVASRSKT